MDYGDQEMTGCRQSDCDRLVGKRTFHFIGLLEPSAESTRTRRPLCDLYRCRSALCDADWRDGLSDQSGTGLSLVWDLFAAGRGRSEGLLRPCHDPTSAGSIPVFATRGS
ncbi:hypothetical protein CBR_g50653 [Chara braunii]|uniref:Uncharacterized protein n=1 Tax=Chara braunii TaxID=69332 RepID=A0A388M7B6_CHABU|nr:hypothetical protein CBR_g50653 [Chara braunii]|eukprot:GBG90405.1 hypothetical protein CBR_g50653 [Chara braunii]